MVIRMIYLISCSGASMKMIVKIQYFEATAQCRSQQIPACLYRLVQLTNIVESGRSRRVEGVGVRGSHGRSCHLRGRAAAAEHVRVIAD